MFGIYSNRRISENERKVLNQGPDDYNWYQIVLGQLFKDTRRYQIRDDIELPDDGDGTLIMFEGESVVYFRTVDGKVGDDEIKQILDVCSYVRDLFKRPIVAYIACYQDFELDCDVPVSDDLKIVFSKIDSDDGEKQVEKLEKKLINNEVFSVPDSIRHILLPFMGYEDKEVFQQKYKHYMSLFDSV